MILLYKDVMMKRRLLKWLILAIIPLGALFCFYLVNDGRHFHVEDLSNSYNLQILSEGQGEIKGICQGQWIREYNRFHKDSLKNLSRVKSTRFLGYWCDGTGYACGGFCNRMYGIISVFYLAILTNRVFFIHWGGPERLDDFLLPNMIDWTIKPNTKTYNRKRRWGDPVGSLAGFDSSMSRGDGESHFYNWIEKDADIDALFNNQVESLESIWYFAEQLERNPRLKESWRTLGLPASTDAYTLLGCAVEILFRKSPYMEQQLSKAKSALKFPSQKPVFIGIHIRTNDHHWGDQHPANERTRNLETVRNCAISVENVLKAKFNLEKPIMWFLASDRAEIKSDWKKRHPNKVITQGFIPKHSEKHAGKVTLTNSLTDIFLLSESDFMIGTRDSTYSNVAIGVGGFPADSWVYGEYCNEINNKTLKPLIQIKKRNASSPNNI